MPPKKSVKEESLSKKSLTKKSSSKKELQQKKSSNVSNKKSSMSKKSNSKQNKLSVEVVEDDDTATIVIPNEIVEQKISLNNKDSIPRISKIRISKDKDNFIAEVSRKNEETKESSLSKKTSTSITSKNKDSKVIEINLDKFVSKKNKNSNSNNKLIEKNSGELITKLDKVSEQKKKKFGPIKKQKKDPKDYTVFDILFGPNFKEDILGIKEKEKYDCIERSNLKLKDYQEIVAEHLIKNPSALVVYETGLGKTLIAVTASQCFLDEFPNSKVVVVTTKKLLNNIPKELDKYGNAIGRNNYIYLTFDKFVILCKEGKMKELCGGNMLIVDEVQTARNYETDIASYLMAGSRIAKKVLLMTATPYYNNFTDFIPLINMLYRDYVVGPVLRADTLSKNKKNLQQPQLELFLNSDKWQNDRIGTKNSNDAEVVEQNIRDNLKMISKFLKGKTFFARKGTKGFPNYKIHLEPIKMTINFQEKYFEYLDKEGDEGLFKKPEAFLNGYRRAVNLGDGEMYGQKIEKIYEKILEGKQTVIYSNWIEFGLDIVTKKLNEGNIKYGVISGSTSEEEVISNVMMYNSKKIQVLIITKAGGEGIDLKNTRYIFVLDLPWNYSSLLQIIGRGVRYLSHDSLPKNEQKVDIYIFIMIEYDLESYSKSKSGDVIMYNIIKRKELENDRTEKILSKISGYKQELTYDDINYILNKKLPDLPSGFWSSIL